jgi:hypothetical protein
MSRTAFRYHLRGVPAADAEDTLLLAIVATEALRGEAQVRLDARHYFDFRSCACVIDAGTRVGRDLNRLFVGLLRHEFGADAFRVDRVGRAAQPTRSRNQPKDRCRSGARKQRA